MLQLLTTPVMGAAAWMWLYLFTTLFGALFLELKAHGKSHEPVSPRKAAILSLIYAGMAVVQGFVIWGDLGTDAATRYYSGVVMEYVLSLDNLAVFYIILKQFGFLQKERQHLQMNILLIGVIGTFILRGIILLSASYIDQLTSVRYGVLAGFVARLTNQTLSPLEILEVRVAPVIVLFGGFILYGLIKGLMGDEEEEETDYTTTGLVGWLRRKGMPFDTNPEATQFWSKFGLTTVGVAIIATVGADVMFGFDSAAVIIGIAHDPFLSIAASFWAVAGLRSLYFLMVAAQNRLWALEGAITGLLWVIGLKLVLGGFGLFEVFGVTPYQEAIGSFAVVFLIIGAGVVVSLVKPQPRPDDVEGPITVRLKPRPNKLVLAEDLFA